MKSKKKDIRKTAGATISQPVSPADSRRWLYVLGLFLAIAIVFEVYQPALYGPFLFDDNYLPFRLPRFQVEALRPWLSGVRPLLMFSYWVNYQLSGFETFSYHAFNVLFHAANAVLIFLIVRKILQWAGVEKERLDILAGFAGGVFLLHPVQAESVAYIASRSEDLSGLFFFAAYAAFLYRRSTEISWSARGCCAAFVRRGCGHQRAHRNPTGAFAVDGLFLEPRLFLHRHTPQLALVRSDGGRGSAGQHVRHAHAAQRDLRRILRQAVHLVRIFLHPVPRNLGVCTSVPAAGGAGRRL